MLKLTSELADAVRARLKAFQDEEVIELTYAVILEGTDEKARKMREDNGTFDVIISTEVKDRAGEIVRQNGWDMENYKNNPIVLWGHDYYSMPIGVCLETYNTTYRGVPALGARGVFLATDINPFAQQVRKLYEFGTKVGQGVGCTTSVGFIPKEFDPNDQSVITRAELLEFSFVDVPANQGVGPAQGRSLTIAEATELGLDVVGMSVKGIHFDEKAKEKESEAGDACQMDDGSPGILASDPKDPDGAMVCIPQTEDKSTPMAEDDSLMKSIAAEHTRHVGVVTKAIADYHEKASTVIEDQPDPSEDKSAEELAEMKAAKADGVQAHLKALVDRMHEEHDMHRSQNVDTLRNFTPPSEKAFNMDDCVKAMKDEHKAYDGKCFKSLDELADRVKSVDAQGDDHTDWITGELAGHQGEHLTAVTAIVKDLDDGSDESMDDADSDEKAIALLIMAVAAEVGAKDITEAVALKIGAKLSSATKDRLKEAHDHLAKGIEVIKALHGGLGSDADDEAAGKDPEEKDGHGASAADGLDEFMGTRDLARSLAGSLNSYLAESREVVRLYHRGK